MLILSHRGFWKNLDEKNSRTAFSRSFEAGFGVETDVRDLDGNLVISHDPPRAGAIPVEEFLAGYSLSRSPSMPLALNIKSDGLPGLLAPLLERYAVSDYFVFDMSVPDTLGYLRRGLQVFTRHSEYEERPAFYSEAAGVWMDCFLTDWIDSPAVEAHLAAGKRVCIVSPELHGRPHGAWWDSFRGTPAARSSEVMLCTDFPDRAKEHFDAR